MPVLPVSEQVVWVIAGGSDEDLAVEEAGVGVLEDHV